MKDLFLSSILVSLFTGALLLLRKWKSDKFQRDVFRVLWLLILLKMVLPASLLSSHAPFTLKTFDPGAVIRKQDVSLHPLPRVMDFPKGKRVNPAIDESGSKEAEVPVSVAATPPITAKAAPPISEVQTPSYWQPETIILWIWRFGFLGSLLWNLAAYAHFRRGLLTYARVVSPEEVTSNREPWLLRIPIYASATAPSPMVVGFIKPCLVLPENFFTAPFASSDRNHILAHEGMHLKKKDHWYKGLYLLGRCIHWFNPIVYFIGDIMNRDIELACDESVLMNRSPEYKLDYCKTILNTCGSNFKSMECYSTGFSKGAEFMKTRFENVLRPNVRKKSKKLLMLFATIIALSSLLLSCESNKAKGLKPGYYKGSTTNLLQLTDDQRFVLKHFSSGFPAQTGSYKVENGELVLSGDEVNDKIRFEIVEDSLLIKLNTGHEPEVLGFVDGKLTYEDGSDIQNLFEKKTPFVGSSSASTAVVDEILNRFGLIRGEIELLTEDKHGIRIQLKDKEGELSAASLRVLSAPILALIDNLEEVQWIRSNGTEAVFTIEDMNSFLPLRSGESFDLFRNDPERFRELIYFVDHQGRMELDYRRNHEELLRQTLLKEDPRLEEVNNRLIRVLIPAAIDHFETEEILKIYAVVHRHEFTIENNKLYSGSGSSIPQVFIYSKEKDGTLRFTENIVAEDGEHAAPSIAAFCSDKPEVAVKLRSASQPDVSLRIQEQLNRGLDAIGYKGSRDITN